MKVTRFEPDKCALLLIDYQVGTLQLSRTNPPDIALRNAIMLAKTALAFDMPIVLTSSQEDQAQGRVDEKLQRVLPEAFRSRVQRAGIVDAWDDDRFKSAVESTGRKQLIMGAITTDICLLFPSISAVREGYSVKAVMDACGSPYEMNEAISRETLKAGGVEMTVTNTMVAELVNDWSSPQGRALVPLLTAPLPMVPVE